MKLDWTRKLQILPLRLNTIAKVLFFEGKRGTRLCFQPTLIFFNITYDIKVDIFR